MDFLLSELRNTSRPKKTVRRIGRGPGSKRGKTAGRGSKGAGSRRGYQRRFGYEGGQVPLFRKLPIRGFTRGRFAKPKCAITLAQIERHFAEGEMVNPETLHAKGLVPRIAVGSVKVIATGELSKRVEIEVHAFSDAAKRFLEEKGISFKVIG